MLDYSKIEFLNILKDNKNLHDQIDSQDKYCLKNEEKTKMLTEIRGSMKVIDLFSLS